MEDEEFFDSDEMVYDSEEEAEEDRKHREEMANTVMNAKGIK